MVMSLKQAQEFMVLEMQIAYGRDALINVELGTERAHVLAQALSVLTAEHDKLIAFHRKPKSTIPACPHCGSTSIRCGCD